MPEREKLTDRTCALCGATIHLVKGGKDRVGTEWFRWVTHPDKPKDTWKCLPNRDFPVRSHSPKGERA